MTTYKLVLAYDGTRFAGWQIQPNATAIQEILEEAISPLVHEKIRLIGAGRTDSGVHALGQVAHFTVEKECDPTMLFRAINARIPYDIRLLSIEKVHDTFHAQKDARAKIYHYHLALEPVVSPFTRLYCLHVPYALDLELLRQACRFFVGTHDFTSFSCECEKGACRRNPVRTLYRLDLVPEEGGVRLEFEGSGFLYKMVRNIVGLLIEIARGKMSIHDIEPIFAARDRKAAPRNVPAKGLFLVRVMYPEEALPENEKS
jgi:tRNA pseudouridine38-40 synthase